MSVAEKLVSGLVLIGLVTTMVLPKRQTPQVIDATGKAGSALFGTVMGTK